MQEGRGSDEIYQQIVRQEQAKGNGPTDRQTDGQSGLQSRVHATKDTKMEEWRGSKESEVDMKVNEVKNEEEEDQKEESWSNWIGQNKTESGGQRS